MKGTIIFLKITVTLIFTWIIVALADWYLDAKSETFRDALLSPTTSTVATILGVIIGLLMLFDLTDLLDN